MEGLSDDEFDHVRDFDLSDSDEEIEKTDDHDTPSTTPPRNQTPRPSNRKISTCPYEGCLKTFNRNARLQEHLRSHTGERPFKCPDPTCNKTFMRETHLKRHMTSAHTDIRDYKCTWEDCDKSFSTGTRLRRHLSAHEGKEKYRCRGYKGCNETFRKHETLKKHILVVHENQKPFPCTEVCAKTGEQCSQSFQTAEKLKNHHQAVHDDTRFSCTICLAESAAEDAKAGFGGFAPSDDCFFATFSDLQAHIKEVHPPTCQYCPTSFRSNKELTRHLELLHGVIDSNKVDVKQYPCSYSDCNQVFTKQGNLNVHIKTVHEKQKDYVCGKTDIEIPPEVNDISKAMVHGCGRSFTSKASLVEHVRTAHFHLPNRRSQRRLEQKLSKELDSEACGELETKHRAPRKDKGVKKSSVLTSLTGLGFGVDEASAKTTNPIPSSLALSSYAEEVFYDSADDTADFDQLSGSMTMCEDHLFYQGQRYQMVSENNSADSTMLDDVQYVPCLPDSATVIDDQTEPFFQFENEHEHKIGHKPSAYPIAIDPLLLASGRRG